MLAVGLALAADESVQVEAQAGFLERLEQPLERRFLLLGQLLEIHQHSVAHTAKTRGHYEQRCAPALVDPGLLRHAALIAQEHAEAKRHGSLLAAITTH